MRGWIGLSWTGEESSTNVADWPQTPEPRQDTRLNPGQSSFIAGKEGQLCGKETVGLAYLILLIFICFRVASVCPAAILAPFSAIFYREINVWFCMPFVGRQPTATHLRTDLLCNPEGHTSFHVLLYSFTFPKMDHFQWHF